jgi:hypothetical protein
LYAGPIVGVDVHAFEELSKEILTELLQSCTHIDVYVDFSFFLSFDPKYAMAQDISTELLQICAHIYILNGPGASCRAHLRSYIPIVFYFVGANPKTTQNQPYSVPALRAAAPPPTRLHKRGCKDDPLEEAQGSPTNKNSVRYKT